MPNVYSICLFYIYSQNTCVFIYTHIYINVCVSVYISIYISTEKEFEENMPKSSCGIWMVKYRWIFLHVPNFKK